MNNFDIFGTHEIIQKKLPVALTFGNFDGVHLGHQFLISSMLKTCPKPIVVMIFEPHPANFFKPHEPKKFLTTMHDKIALLLKCGVDTVVVQKFTPEFSFMNANDFCTNFLSENFNIHHIFLGYNLSYGKDRHGNFFHMKQFENRFGWHVVQLAALEDAPGHIISSTRIRNALTDAQPHLAETLLGRPYSIAGTVIRGDGRGCTLGFPTANISFDDSIVMPHYGVYACEVEFMHKHPNKRFWGVMNCGVRPTIASNESKVQIETHILNFNEDVYDEKVVFHVKAFIRNEQKFANLSNLQDQMKKDVDFALIKFNQPKRHG